MDIRKFLNYIQDNPAIWDNNHFDFMDRDIKNQCWSNVGENLFPNWFEMTSEDREERTKAMKSRWKNIRDAYMKFHNLKQTNPGTKKKYVYSEELKFLEGYAANPNRRESSRKVDDEEICEDVKMRVEQAKLIDCIRTNPAIWNNQHSKYTNRFVRVKCWTNIGINLFPNWHMMTSDEKEEATHTMKSKWKNIKDSYTKYQRSIKTNPDTKKHIHAEGLKFLEDHVNKGRRKKSDDDDDEEDSEETEDVKEEVQNMETDDAMEEAAASPPHSSNERASTDQQAPIKRKVITRISGQSIHVRRRREDITEPDKAFLFSLLPDYRKLTYKQKLDFRMYALGFFKQIDNENSQLPVNGKR